MNRFLVAGRPSTAWFAALAAAALCACEEPPVRPSADLRQRTFTGRIDGHVVVQTAARGNVLVFLYDADREPPPRGSARPLSFTVIPRERLFEGARDGQTGPYTAPFSFSLVAKGRYELRAVLDRDGCVTAPADDCRRSDIVPWFGVTAEPNRGDIGGGAVDPSTGTFNVYEVTEAEDGRMNAVTGVVVGVRDSAAVPVDRPAFTVAMQQDLGPQSILTLRVQPIREGAVDQRAPVFLVRWADDDGNGIPDDVNGDGVPEVYPRVVIRKIAEGVESGLVDENDLDRNGALDESGADYPHVDGVSDGRPDQVVLAAGVDPAPFMSQLVDGTGAPVFNSVQATELRVVIQPVALDLATRERLAAVPPGKYSVTLVQFTGQTWRVPNELQPAVAAGLGLPASDDQGFWLVR